MGVYALTTAKECTADALTTLQAALGETANAFCLLDTYTAANLPDSYDFASANLSMKKLDIDVSEQGDGNRPAAIALFVAAALCFAMALVTLTRFLI